MEFLALLSLLAVLVWFWAEGRRVHELAVMACKKACRAYQLQLLDATVALTAIRLARDNHGLHLRRAYQFHFSQDGVSRAVGHIQMLGDNVEVLDFGGSFDHL